METKNYTVRKNKIGYQVIPMSQIDVIRIFGGHGICDHCGKPDYRGFLTPVLGRKWYCTPCHMDWEIRGKFYPEDVPYETQILEYFGQEIDAYYHRKKVMSEL